MVWNWYVAAICAEATLALIVALIAWSEHRRRTLAERRMAQLKELAHKAVEAGRQAVEVADASTVRWSFPEAPEVSR